ncbi:hypothetical protein GCM10009736_03770 [Actinomadura bangladeshensis]
MDKRERFDLLQEDPLPGLRRYQMCGVARRCEEGGHETDDHRIQARAFVWGQRLGVFESPFEESAKQRRRAGRRPDGLRHP